MRVARSSPSSAPARGRGGWRLARGAILLVATTMAWAGTTSLAPEPRPTGPEVGDRRVVAANAHPHLAQARPADRPDDWRSHVLATHDGVEVVQPSPAVAMVGFHEAGRPGARSLALASTPDAQDGTTTVPDPDVDDDLPSRVLPTRGRANGPATAVDVAMEAGEPVHAPVSGTVASVDPYLLYGEHPDTRIVVTPDGRPDLGLVVLHVTGEQVAVGDRVEAGTDVLAASANPLPFTSQIDEYTVDASGVAAPHVHLELRPAGDP